MTYIYIYIYIYTYIYAYVCVYIYIYIYPEVPTVPLNGTGHISKQNGPKNRTVP